MESSILKNKTIAYFCAEFALENNLPIYSGGLGVLAGDCLRQAAEDNLPLIGVGLLYKQGYFKQVITPSGMQNELPAYNNIESSRLTRLHDSEYVPMRIKIYLGDRVVFVQLWKYQNGNLQVILLDTDVEENSESDRRLTLSLYPTDSDWRIQQEIILGVGGVRALHALNIIPDIYHMNEGHSAFAVLEVAHQQMKSMDVKFDDAFKYACSKIVFTNHTLIPSGNDIFHVDQVARILGNFTKHLGLEHDQVVAMGALPDNPEYFSMTHLALAASKVSSAVSKSHAQFARISWPDFNLIPITNGVHRGTWQHPRLQEIGEKFARGLEVSDGSLWRTHQDLKEALCEYVLAQTGVDFAPEVLTLSWARRVALYKQPLLIFKDIQRLKKIILNEHYPVQIIMAGKAHPGDTEAKAALSNILSQIKLHGLEKSIVFIPNYDLDMASVLTSGSDVWLNTPEKGKEACGTSGMKAALNGVVQCAVSDGWTDEINLHELGFSIDPQDSVESFYNLLENEIVKKYYTNRDVSGAPSEWIALMRSTMQTVEANFTSKRMLSEYVDKLYKPVLN